MEPAYLPEFGDTAARRVSVPKPRPQCHTCIWVSAMKRTFRSLAVVACWFAAPVVVLGDEEPGYRWYFESRERWCLQHDEKDLCLPKKMQATGIRPNSASFELAGSSYSPDISIIASASSVHPFNEESFGGIPVEFVGSGEIGGIERAEFRVDRLTFVKLQLTPSLHVLIIGADADRIDRWVSNLAAQWQVNTRTHSNEGSCAEYFMPSCVTESPDAIQLIEAIDEL